MDFPDFCEPPREKFRWFKLLEWIYLAGSFAAICVITWDWFNHHDLFTRKHETTARIEIEPQGTTELADDYALAATGGQIEKIIETQNYGDDSYLFGIKICNGANGPSEMIQASTAPGECWAFQGYNGRAVIKLRSPVKINAVTLEHIPGEFLPHNNNRSSAPKDFRITGSNNSDKRGKYLGQFKYDINGKAVQTFPVNNAEDFYRFVDFEVLTNHGNEEFTCVYRLQVHGEPLNQ